MDDRPTLDRLAPHRAARIAHVAWDDIPSDDAKRLRALGIDEGAEVAVVHRGMFGGRDPLAVRLGRMTIALRRSHAAAIAIAEFEAESAAS
ncbi:ferrous iron transport protein A [Altererythrobacter aurantiacus]|uniref:Ferrous iron transport protein A n=1 Tax=Parapontixanthobacter aurantiacus TaxID=1463599 RepID=A0A844ZBT1_9SPHN|nr:FeoA family protein [Parapontixanthobacter aurantiacus]MXO84477.1 ferrous iron transport protein A [Parapontixanthobacter aurantiacus]